MASVDRCLNGYVASCFAYLSFIGFLLLSSIPSPFLRMGSGLFKRDTGFFSLFQLKVLYRGCVVVSCFILLRFYIKICAS